MNQFSSVPPPKFWQTPRFPSAMGPAKLKRYQFCGPYESYERIGGRPRFSATTQSGTASHAGITAQTPSPLPPQTDGGPRQENVRMSHARVRSSVFAISARMFSMSAAGYSERYLFIFRRTHPAAIHCGNSYADCSSIA